MPLYNFVWNLLAWSITVAVLFPLTIPWTVLAYKIWNGNKELEEEFAEEMWARAWRASLAFALAGVLIVGLDYATVDWLGLPASIVHCVYYIGFLTLAAGIMHYCFFMEDLFQGLNLAVIFLYIPTFVLFLLWLLIRSLFSFGLFSYVLSWLKDPAAP
jgi:hypothetical protein